jgi:hypothetical protein
MATVKVKGEEQTLAPLKSLQVADLLDDLANDKDNKTSTATVIRRSLRVVAQSLGNGGAPQGTTIDDAIATLNDGIEFKDLDAAFAQVMDITGLRKTKEGEAPAAESTSTESSAAS